jgi:signal transduction histidine kinase
VFRSRLLPLLLLLFLPHSTFPQTPAAPTPKPAPITSLGALRQLPPETAARRQPVRIQGVITAVNWDGTLFFQDETGGSFFNLRPEFRHFRPGDRIELEGISHAGSYVPGIHATKARLIERVPLPTPTPATYDILLSGHLHYQRVAVSGIIRAVEPEDKNTWSITLASGQQRLEIRYRPEEPTPMPPLVDAQVRVSGLAAGFINQKRQLVRPQIFLNNLSDLAIEQAPPPPFSLPLFPISRLLNFTPNGTPPHRVRVRGVVTYHQPEEALFLRDDDRGLLVRTRQKETLSPGDVVEVVGFPVMGNFSAVLEDAEFRRTGHAPEPRPVPAQLTGALKGENDADLVSLEAQLIEVLQGPEETVLLLRQGESAFRARLPRTPLDLRNGSTLRLHGVCRVDTFTGSLSFRANPRSMELLLRSPADITVLKAPSRWTAQRMGMAALVLLLVVLASLSWVAVLRRRVREQTEVIRQRIEREAVLEERQRVAREMHDTLAQSFSGVGFQLEALDAQLPADTGLKRCLATAKQLVRHGQEEFRRSLLNLRAQELERGNLATALGELGQQVTAGSGISFELLTHGHLPRLPEAVENNLLRIGQECLTNAVTHARPRRITAELRREENRVHLIVRDDGSGISQAHLDQPQPGHFGWRGIRERAEQISAQVHLESEPGAGTTVQITVTLPST